MSMTVPVAQLRIARDIRQAEDALNEALLRHSSLFTTMVSARRETDAGAFVGHEALLRLAKSQQALLDVQREMGVGDECPDEGEPTGRLAAG